MPGCPGVNPPVVSTAQSCLSRFWSHSRSACALRYTDMVDIDNQICFGAITKGDFSSPSSGIVTPPPLPRKEGRVVPDDTPPHKAVAQWRVLERSCRNLDLEALH